VVTVVAESVPHLRLGAQRDFRNIMLSSGYWDDNAWNETGKYSFSNGSFIEFISFDKFGKAHGPRRDVLFLNEANNLPYNIADQLITRTRKIVWMDWNPSEEFWFYTEMLGKRPDIDFIGDGGNYPPLTYLDNEALDEVSKGEIESHRHNKQWWTVYGEGKLGEIVNRIFTGWAFIDDIPHEARLERYGLDFGYTNDPSAIVAVYYYNGGYILDEILFQKGMSNKQLADTILNQRRAMVIADSAEPKSIDEIALHGINIQPALKGQGSVSTGIQGVQVQQISVTKRSVNILKEYRNYLWETDKDGRITNEPDHNWSHSMDAIRYAMTSLVPLIQRKEMIENRPRYEMKKRVNPAR
jgi:phage terminase large subunit